MTPMTSKPLTPLPNPFWCTGSLVGCLEHVYEFICAGQLSCGGMIIYLAFPWIKKPVYSAYTLTETWAWVKLTAIATENLMMCFDDKHTTFPINASEKRPVASLQRKPCSKPSGCVDSSSVWMISIFGMTSLLYLRQAGKTAPWMREKLGFPRNSGVWSHRFDATFKEQLLHVTEEDY